MKENGTDISALDHASVDQDEKNHLYGSSLVNAVKNGYLVVVDDYAVLEDTYRELCGKEGRAWIAVYSWGYIASQTCGGRHLDRLLALAREARRRYLGGRRTRLCRFHR